ncbi:MAG: hypothetical protein WCX97_00255 [Candidatus Magasanikbacteria bacterium]
MSLKRRVQSQLHNLVYSLRTWSIPAWVDGQRARIAMFAVFILFFGGYILKTNSMAVSGYKLHELESNISQLDAEIQRLETESISYSSIQSIKERAKDVEMVAVGKIQHINPAETVAVR